MATAPVSAPSVEETLEWEAAQRSRAGWAAILAAVLLFGGFLVSAFALNDTPDVVLTDGVRDLLGQPIPGGPQGLQTARAMWLDDHGPALIALAVVSAIGSALIVVVLGYLFRALQARRPETSRFVLYAVLAGPILYGIGPLITIVGVVISSSSYVSDGRFSTLGAHDAVQKAGGIELGQGFGLIGTVATAVAVVFVSLYAMQVGLLTRFLGILGAVVGVVLLLQLLGPPAIVESFWLLSLGLLILGKVRAVPPAWAAGHAVPWPSQQQLRERQDHDSRVATRTEPRDADDAQVAEEPSSGSVAVEERPKPHSSSNKRKRKRR